MKIKVEFRHFSQMQLHQERKYSKEDLNRQRKGVMNNNSDVKEFMNVLMKSSFKDDESLCSDQRQKSRERVLIRSQMSSAKTQKYENNPTPQQLSHRTLPDMKPPLNSNKQMIKYPQNESQNISSIIQLQSIQKKLNFKQQPQNKENFRKINFKSLQTTSYNQAQQEKWNSKINQTTSGFFKQPLLFNSVSCQNFRKTQQTQSIKNESYKLNLDIKVTDILTIIFINQNIQNLIQKYIFKQIDDPEKIMQNMFEKVKSAQGIREQLNFNIKQIPSLQDKFKKKNEQQEKSQKNLFASNQKNSIFASIKSIMHQQNNDETNKLYRIYQIRKMNFAILRIIQKFRLMINQNCNDISMMFPKKPFAQLNSKKFFIAVKQNDSQLVENLLSKNKYLVYDHDELNQTALHLAAKKGNVEILQILVNGHSDINKSDIMGRTALYIALQQNKYVASKYLLSQQADPWQSYHLSFKHFMKKNERFHYLIKSFRKMYMNAKMVHHGLKHIQTNIEKNSKQTFRQIYAKMIKIFIKTDDDY